MVLLIFTSKIPYISNVSVFGDFIFLQLDLKSTKIKFLKILKDVESPDNLTSYRDIYALSSRIDQLVPSTTRRKRMYNIHVKDFDLHWRQGATALGRFFFRIRKST